MNAQAQNTPRNDADEVARLRARVSELEAERVQWQSLKAELEQADRTQRRFNQHLAGLVEISNELTRCEKVDDLFRKAVALGRVRLGVDRLGIWLRTDEPEVIAGTFGVDVNGQICDERDRRARLDPNDPDGRIVLQQEPFVEVGERVLYDEQGEEVGQSTQIFAALWDGNQVIGHLSADNSLKSEEIQPHQKELLRLFGAVVGYLCTRKRAEEERRHLIEELQEALLNIKTLRGLIPICAHCKKVRDDDGYWQRLDEFVRAHSDAQFSHSLCPHCTEELYPELQAKRDKAAPGAPSSSTGRTR